MHDLNCLTDMEDFVYLFFVLVLPPFSLQFKSWEVFLAHYESDVVLNAWLREQAACVTQQAACMTCPPRFDLADF